MAENEQEALRRPLVPTGSDDDTPLEPPREKKVKVEKVELTSGHFKKFTSYPFITAALMVGISTVLFVFDGLAFAKVNFISVSDWRWVALAETVAGLVGFAYFVSLVTINQRTVGSAKLKPYEKWHWFPYTICSMVMTVNGGVHLIGIWIQYATYGNRLTVSDFDPTSCTVISTGSIGCQYDAAQAAARWATVQYVAMGLWVLLMVSFERVCEREQFPQFTEKYKANVTETSTRHKRVRIVKQTPIGGGSGDESEEISD